MPLALVESQQYIHYNKGALAMYALRDYVGEERVNGALRAFLTRREGCAAAIPRRRTCCATCALPRRTRCSR